MFWPAVWPAQTDAEREQKRADRAQMMEAWDAMPGDAGRTWSSRPDRSQSNHNYYVSRLQDVRAFAALDTDGNATLTPAELAAAPAALLGLDLNDDGQLGPFELDLQAISLDDHVDQWLAPLIQAIDPGADGLISDELAELPARLATLDQDEDGTLDLTELAPASQRITHPWDTSPGANNTGQPHEAIDPYQCPVGGGRPDL
jgi:hypothetical protein